jgi:hypothetical protein
VAGALAPRFADQALRAVALAGALALVAVLTCVPLGANDFWLQAHIGGMVWSGQGLPQTVLFAFTEVRDFPFHAHEWLPSVAFHLMLEGLGYRNLQFVQGALGLAAFWLAFRLARRLTASYPVALYLALVAMVGINYRFFMRPEIFALIFILLQLNLLAEYQLTRRLRYLAWMVPLALVWANCHGSFPVSLVIIGLAGAGDAVDAALAGKGETFRARLRAGLRALAPSAAFGVAMLLATLANPYGYRLFVFAWEFSRWELTRLMIIEWLPTFSADFMESHAFAVYVYLLLLCAVAVAAFRRQLAAADVLLLAVFGALSMDRLRHVVLFALVAVYVVARLTGPRYAAAPERRPLALLIAAIALGGGWVAQKGNLYRAYPYYTASNNFSEPMIDFIRERRLQGNVLNSFSLGAELIYRFYPDLRPAVDSRIDAYGESYNRYLEHIMFNEAAMLAFIERYDVRYMLLLHWEFNNIRGMKGLQQSGWRMLMTDHRMVLLERRSE